METPSLEKLASDLGDESVDIVTRMRALFFARFYDTPEAITALEKCLTHESVLLRHEAAYVMGQMRQPSALPLLIALLDNRLEDPMVRHEAGEGIAALGLLSAEAFAALRRHEHDPDPAVSETCHLALIGLERTAAKVRAGNAETRPQADPSKGFFIFTGSHRVNDETPLDAENRIIKEVDESNYRTNDPAEGHAVRSDPKAVSAETDRCRIILLDDAQPLWDRYVAMFTLRNISTPESVQVLAAALDTKSSALMRHEVCFVLGQVQLPGCMNKLIERLEDTDEHCMVRHEAALALGSVGVNVYSDIGKATRMSCIKFL